MLSKTHAAETAQRKTLANQCDLEPYSAGHITEALEVITTSKVTKPSNAKKFRDNLGLTIITKGEVPLSMQRLLPAYPATPADLLRVYKIFPTYSFSMALYFLQWVERSKEEEKFPALQLELPKIYKY